MGNWRDKLRKVEPYVPGEQPKDAEMIKLNTNENPYPPAKGVAEVLRTLETGELRLYPQTDAGELAAALAEEYGVEKEQVFIGIGSDDVLGMAFLTCFAQGDACEKTDDAASQNPDGKFESKLSNIELMSAKADRGYKNGNAVDWSNDTGKSLGTAGGDEVLFPDITYSFYPVWAELFGIPYRRPALDENFRIRREDYYVKNGGIVIANPNAPTSIAEDLDFIEDIVSRNPDSVVIVDEAYIDFGGKSAIPLLKKYENLLVVQTFSKSRSMAGMRIGFAIGNRELIAALHAVRNSYNSYPMNLTAIRCGVASVRDRAYFKETCSRIAATREKTAERLKTLGFTVLPSSANFLFVSHPQVSAAELQAYLRARHIYVRHFAQPRIENYLRVTIGTEEQMEKFLEVTERCLTSR